MRIAPLILLSLASISEASLLRGVKTDRKLKGNKGANPCNAEEAAAMFGDGVADPLLVAAFAANCNPIPDLVRDDVACVPKSAIPTLDPVSTCNSAEDCTATSETCYCVPGPNGPVTWVGHCFASRAAAAANVNGVQVGLEIPKEVCPEVNIAIGGN